MTSSSSAPEKVQAIGAGTGHLATGGSPGKARNVQEVVDADVVASCS